MSQDPSHSDYSALTHFFMSMSHKYINLKESYNQDIQEQVTTKNFLKKKAGLTWNPQSQRHSVQARCFQIQSPICYVKFSNNVSVRRIRVNDRKTNLNRPLKSYNHHLPSLLDLIISPHVQHPPINFPKKVFSPMRSFFALKRSSPILCRGRRDTMLYLHIFSNF